MKGASRMGSCAPRPWPWQSASTAQALRPASGSVSGSSAPSLQSSALQRTRAAVQSKIATGNARCRVITLLVAELPLKQPPAPIPVFVDRALDGAVAGRARRIHPLASVDYQQREAGPHFGEEALRQQRIRRPLVSLHPPFFDPILR